MSYPTDRHGMGRWTPLQSADIAGVFWQGDNGSIGYNGNGDTIIRDMLDTYAAAGKTVDEAWTAITHAYNGSMEVRGELDNWRATPQRRPSPLAAFTTEPDAAQ